jgi:hypothetical protein
VFWGVVVALAPFPPGPAAVDLDADTDPLPASRGGAPTVPRTREPRPPTPAGGTSMPTLPRARPPRREPPRQVPAGGRAEPATGRVAAAVADRPRWWPTRRPPGRAAATAHVPEIGRVSRATVLIALAALAAALGAAGIAVAAWLSSGSGRPGVTAGNALAPTTSTVAGSAVTSGLLVPGSSGTAVVTLTNPNPDEVRVGAVAATLSWTAAPSATSYLPGVDDGGLRGPRRVGDDVDHVVDGDRHAILKTTVNLRVRAAAGAWTGAWSPTLTTSAGPCR